MVTPVVVNPFQREVVIDVGDRYEKGNLWFDPLPHFRPAGFGIDKGFDQPEVQPALQSPLARAYLRWSRFPFVQVNPVSRRRHLDQRLSLRERRHRTAGRAVKLQ